MAGTQPPQDLHFERRGSGEPLVLLHGIGHHWYAWEPVLDRLAGHHDVVAVDLPGFGSSPWDEERSRGGMPALVVVMQEFFAQHGLGRPHVVGNSFGGALALELAAAGAVASVTALSPAGFATERQVRRALGTLRVMRALAHAPEPLLRLFYRYPVTRAAGFRTLFARPGFLTAEAALRDTRALRDAKGFRVVAGHAPGYAFRGAVTVPVTIAWGTRDRILSYRQAGTARQLVANALHVDLPGCGHVPMGDAPELVSEIILGTTGAAHR